MFATLEADPSLLNGFAWPRYASHTVSTASSAGVVDRVRAFEQMGRAALLVDGQSRVLEFNAHVQFGLRPRNAQRRYC